MIFNLDLEKIWEKNKTWNLDKRSMFIVDSKWATNTFNTTSKSILPMLSEDFYITKIQSTGKYIANNTTTNTILENITSDSVDITGHATAYGIGLPYYVKTGQTIKMRLTASGAVTLYVNLSAYDDDGFLINNSNVGLLGAKNKTSSGEYTVTRDGWVIIIVYPYSPDNVVSVSDISLFIQ